MDVPGALFESWLAALQRPAFASSALGAAFASSALGAAFTAASIGEDAPAGSAAEVFEPPTLEALFRDHADDVYRIVARLLGPGARGADVEDLTQQVFLAAHRALPSFRGDAKPSTWLYGIASKLVLTHLRSRKRQRRLADRLEDDARFPVDGPPQSIEAEVASREELRQVWGCLMEVSEKKRVVLVLHEVEGLSGKEIAEALEVKEATVWTRLHHARRELVERLRALRKEHR